MSVFILTNNQIGDYFSLNDDEKFQTEILIYI